jgi:acyl phosphate:glycerol-3-phosphate acyltransferase
VEFLAYIATIVPAYLLGSIPTGYLAGRSRGIDVRSAGSGNIGATNVFRVLGTSAGLAVFFFDALKGFLACRWIPLLVMPHFSQFEFAGRLAPDNLAIAAGVAAIFGHNYTCWLNFRGGKGVATTAGVFLALMPWVFVSAAAVWLAVLALSKYVSLASIVAALALPLAAWLSRGSETLIFISAILGLLVLYKHKANVQRLMNGTEPRVGTGQRKEQK